MSVFPFTVTHFTEKLWNKCMYGCIYVCHVAVFCGKILFTTMDSLFCLKQDEGHTEWVSCVRFSPNSSNPIIVSAGWDKIVKVLLYIAVVVNSCDRSVLCSVGGSHYLLTFVGDYFARGIQLDKVPVTLVQEILKVYVDLTPS